MSEFDYKRIKSVLGKNIKVVSHKGVTVGSLNENLKEVIVSKGFNLAEVKEDEYLIYV